MDRNDYYVLINKLGKDLRRTLNARDKAYAAAGYTTNDKVAKLHARANDIRNQLKATVSDYAALDN